VATEKKSTGIITGFCGMGQHEGTRPKSYLGNPMKTCERIIHDPTGKPKWNCACKCHTDLDKLFEMSGMDRVIQVNPEYQPVKINVILPTIEERAARFKAKDIVPPRVVESPLPDRVPATIERVFTPTSTGRAARGELELWVKKECDQWILDKPEDSCTPAYISERIAEKQGIKAPSVGAISAVFDRWTALGYALIAKKPTRFVGYMPDGVKYGLEGLKDRARKAKQQGRR
jgi:hypothetical protein